MKLLNTQNKMRKLLFILLVFVSLATQAQYNQQSITWLRAQDITNTRHFVWQGDTIDFDEFGNILDRVEADGDYLYFYSDTTLLDSAYIQYTARVDTFRIVGDSLHLRLNNDSANYINITSLNAKMDTVVTDSTLTGNGTVDSPLGIDSLVMANNMKTVYSLRLPSESTVAARCAAAVEGADYPTGWVLEAGSNPVDLKVTHGLGRRVAYVTVFSVDGTQERQLFGNAAYSGILTETEDILRVESLATIQKAISIYILIE